MSIGNKMRTLDAMGPWSFIGLLLAVFAGYFTFFWDNGPHLEIQILSKTSILDIKEPVSGLDVLLDSISLTKTNQDLEVIVVKIINTGGEAIAISDYDNDSPVGFLISEGKVIQVPSLLTASNKYLESPGRLNVADMKKISLQPSILNPGDFVTLKVLVLSLAGGETKISPVGVVAGAGVPELLFVNDKSDLEPSFFVELIEGGIWIQIVRLLSYFIVYVGVIFLITRFQFFYYKHFGSVLKKSKKVKLRNSFLLKFGTDKYHNYVTDMYEKHDGEFVKSLYDVLTDTRRLLILKNFYMLDEKYSSDSISVRAFNLIYFPDYSAELEMSLGEHLKMYSSDSESTLIDLVTRKFICWDEKSIQVDEDFIRALKDFISFIDAE